MLFAPGRRISGLISAFGSTENQTDMNSSLLSHLVCFITCFFNHPYFRFAGSWIIGLAMDRAESKGTDVAIGFSG